MNTQKIIEESTILRNIEKINERIEKAVQSSTRNRQEIKLLLATKTQSAETINNALQLGYGLIGENRAQELVEKAPLLLNTQTQITPRETHFIGSLQGNKVNEVTALADCIQTVDRERIARRINQYAFNHHFTQKIMIQVNSCRDPQKQGLLPEALPAFLESISEFKNLEITGLMTIGLQSSEPKIIQQGFADLRILSEKMREQGLLNRHALELSMGMSQDLELAILEGATILRIGSDIFGARLQ